MSQSASTSRRDTSKSAEELPTGHPSNPQISDASSSSRRNSIRRNESENTESKPAPPSTVAPSLQPVEPVLPARQLSGTFDQIGQANTAPTPTQGFGGYTLQPDGPFLWDWNNNMDFSSFTTFYEPQGQLAVQPDVQSPQSPLQDFTMPYKIAVELNPTITPSSQGTPIQQPATAPLPSSGLQTTMGPRPSISDTLASATITRAGTKRKAGSDSVTVTATKSGGATPSPAKRVSLSKPTTAGQPTTSIRPPVTRSQSAIQAPRAPLSQASSDAGSPAASTGAHHSTENRNSSLRRPPDKSQQTAASDLPGVKSLAADLLFSAPEGRKIPDLPRFAAVLPAGKVFPIQIGSELFRLSGASISSDAPSYFSHYFGEQLLQTGGRASAIKTLYIDRDPQTFKDIALHLQGYHVKPLDGEHFVRLFADAQFYSLPRLTQQLFKSEIYIQIGDRHFRIPRDIFSSPGDSPNYFTLGFAHFFSTPSEVFPGLDRQTLLRPPSILPPSVPNRNGDVFADILRLLQGYDVNVVVRNESHRAELLRDARYFHLKGVEQRLLPVARSFNLRRRTDEILLRLEDVRQSGVGFSPDSDSPQVFNPPVTGNDTASSKPATPLTTDQEASGLNSVPIGSITYQRPFIDDTASDLIVEISGANESTHLDFAAMRVTFSGNTKARIASLFQVIANKLNLPVMVPLGLMLVNSGGGIAAQPASPANSGVSGDRVRLRIETDSWIEVDGEALEWDEQDSHLPAKHLDPLGSDKLPRFRRRRREVSSSVEEDGSNDVYLDLVVKRGHWRFRVEASEDDPAKVEVVMCAVKIEAQSLERFRNRRRGFLV